MSIIPGAEASGLGKGGGQDLLPDPDEPEPNWRSEQMRQSRAREGAGPQANACGSDRGLGFSGTFRDNLTR